MRRIRFPSYSAVPDVPFRFAATTSPTVHIVPALGEATRDEDAESFSLEPAPHTDHPKSVFARYRKVADKTPHCRVGHCAKGILPSGFVAPTGSSGHCGIMCCCTAVSLPLMVPSSYEVLMRNESVQDMLEALIAAKICVGDGSGKEAALGRLAPSLAAQLASWKHEVSSLVNTSEARLTPLCADVVGPPTAAEKRHKSGAHCHKSGGTGEAEEEGVVHRGDWLSRLVLTSEEADSVWYFSVLLQDDELQSMRETKHLKSIVSLKVLWVVASIRCKHHPNNHRGPPGGAGKVHSVQVIPEVYESVLSAVLARNPHQSSAGVPQDHLGGVAPHPPIGLVDLALAYTLRHSSPMAFVRFLCQLVRSYQTESSHRAHQQPVVHCFALDLFKNVSEDFIADVNPVAIRSLAEMLLALTDVLSHLPETCAPGYKATLVSLVHTYCGFFIQLLPKSSVSNEDLVASENGQSSPSPEGWDSSLSRLVPQIIQWQRMAPSWMTQELSASMTQILDGIVQSAARSGGSDTVLQLLRKVGLSDVLYMQRMFAVSVPLLRGLHSAQDLVGDLIEQAVVDASLLYTGSVPNMLLNVDNAVALDVFLRAVEQKRRALQSSSEVPGHATHPCPTSDLDVVSSIFEDFALLGKHVFSSQQLQLRVQREREMSRGKRRRSSGETVDPDAALLGGPFEFARYLLSTVRQVWEDIQSFRTEDSKPDDSDGVSDPSAQVDAQAALTTPVTISPSVVRDFTLLLERVVLLSMTFLRNEAPLVCPELAKLIDTSLQLPNLHDEYRRKLFLMVNIDATAAKSGGDGSAAACPEALQKLTAALPLQFLPWASTQITKEVLAASHGHGPRYLHLLRTAVDLQLPPSTARSRIAGVLEVYKLVRSQRDKLPILEYSRLLSRCLLSLPLSYFLSSWTFFVWWTFVGFLVILHVTGWSLEAFYVVRMRRLEFARPLLGEPREAEHLAVSAGGAASQPTTSESPPHMLSSILHSLVASARTLASHPVANTTLVVVVAGGGDTACSSQFQIAEAICRSMNVAEVTPFVLRCPSNGNTGEYLVVDDIMRDAAQRIRREANTTWNPFQRLVFNLFPLFRPSAEEALISLTSRRAASKGVPFTFVLVLPERVFMTEASLQRLRDVFGRQYVSNLVIVVPHSNPSLGKVSKRFELLSSASRAQTVLDAAIACEEGYEDRWNTPAESDSLGAVVIENSWKDCGHQHCELVQAGHSSLADGAEAQNILWVSPLWKFGTFTTIKRNAPNPPLLREERASSFALVWMTRKLAAQSLNRFLSVGGVNDDAFTSTGGVRSRTDTAVITQNLRRSMCSRLEKSLACLMGSDVGSGVGDASADVIQSLRRRLSSHVRQPLKRLVGDDDSAPTDVRSRAGMATFIQNLRRSMSAHLEMSFDWLMGSDGMGDTSADLTRSLRRRLGSHLGQPLKRLVGVDDVPEDSVV